MKVYFCIIMEVKAENGVYLAEFMVKIAIFYDEKYRG